MIYTDLICPALSSSWFVYNSGFCLWEISVGFCIGNWAQTKGKMSSFVGVIVNDTELQSQFTQVELRSLKSKVSIFSDLSSIGCTFVFYSIIARLLNYVIKVQFCGDGLHWF